VTGVEPGGARDPSPRHAVRSAAVHVPTLQATRRPQAVDGAWDAEMTRLLREAAEIREERERARLDQDARSARAEATALLEAIRAHGRPSVKHYVTRPSSPRVPSSAQVAP
jgi:hypothetical protein